MTSRNGWTTARSTRRCATRLGRLILAGALCWAAQYGRAQTSSQQPGEQPASQPAVLTLSDVRDLVGEIKNGIVDEKEVLGLLVVRGVDFRLTAEIADSLRELGATDTLLNAIDRVGPKEQPKRTGSLSLICAPAECQVVIEGPEINGKSTPSTVKGRALITDLPPERVTITFSKEGYSSVQKSVQVLEGAATEASVTLEMTPATREANGKKLLALVLHALGAEKDVKGLQNVTGAGSATVYTAGEPAVWDFDVTIGPPPLVEMKLSKGGSDLIYQCNGERCAERRKSKIHLHSGKKLPEPVAAELESELQVVVRYHFAAFLGALTAAGIRISTPVDAGTPGQEQHLNAEGHDFVYHITVGPDLLPKMVEYESMGGLGSGLRVFYGSYSKLGDAQYPKRTTIRLSDKEQRGIEIRLDSLQAGSKLQPSDFPK